MTKPQVRDNRSRAKDVCIVGRSESLTAGGWS